MNTHLLALQLMAIQGALGAFDTIYHHELTVALPQRMSARVELGIHSVRSMIYGVLFIGLAAWSWHGLWALVLVMLFGVEIVLTLWDFVVEDRTRLLPPTERITHTILAINGGAFLTLLALNLPNWLAMPSALVWQPQGGISLILAIFGVGVFASGVRDGVASWWLGVAQGRGRNNALIQFGGPGQQVLVTGATGFIGQQLVQALLTDGQQVTVLSRSPQRAAWLFGGYVRCIASMDELPPSYHVDVIVNLAGARILGWRWTAARRRILRGSRIDTTVALVNWIERAESKPRLLLSASAVGYYGVQDQAADVELTEQSAPQPIFMSQLCQQWEDVAARARHYGTAVTYMRFGLVLGLGGALPMMLLPIRLGLGGRLGTGKQSLAWIHSHDVLSGMAHLCRISLKDPKAVDGAYNFTAPGRVTQQQFSSVAAQVLRRPCAVPTPGWPLRVMLGEQADILLEGQAAVPARLRDSGFTFRFGELRSALDDLC